MIAVAMRCPCGTNAVVDITAAYTADDRWSCKCPNCYEGTQDAGSRAHCIGYGRDPEMAIAAWWERVEEAWELDYELTERGVELTDVVALWRQVDAEVERQRGWGRLTIDGKRWFGPVREVAP